MKGENEVSNIIPTLRRGSLDLLVSNERSNNLEVI